MSKFHLVKTPRKSRRTTNEELSQGNLFCPKQAAGTSISEVSDCGELETTQSVVNSLLERRSNKTKQEFSIIYVEPFVPRKYAAVRKPMTPQKFMHNSDFINLLYEPVPSISSSNAVLFLWTTELTVLGNLFALQA